MSWQVHKFSKTPQRPGLSSKPSKFTSNQYEGHEKYKTELCRNLDSGFCEYGEKCFYAHSLEELRDKASNSSKTVKCKSFFEVGYCLFGYKCQFAHRDTFPDTAESSPNTSKKTSRKASGEGRVAKFIDLETRMNLI